MIKKYFKFFILVTFIVCLVIAKYIAFDYPISTGKRVGNLTKISLKGKIFKTWEGTLDEGSGDKLTSFFSVRDSKVAQELYEYEGKQVLLYYEQYYLGWPRDTNYNVVSWQKKEEADRDAPIETLYNVLGKTMFCSFLGTLIKNTELYNEVKEFIQSENPYIYNQYSQCND
jgi:hypothetical protein